MNYSPVIRNSHAGARLLVRARTLVYVMCACHAHSTCTHLWRTAERIRAIGPRDAAAAAGVRRRRQRREAAASGRRGWEKRSKLQRLHCSNVSNVSFAACGKAIRRIGDPRAIRCDVVAQTQSDERKRMYLPRIRRGPRRVHRLSWLQVGLRGLQIGPREQ